MQDVLKRVLLFLATNIAVILVLTVVLRVLGIDGYLHQNGLNIQGLAIFAAVFGFGGSFISLLLSKFMAKRATGAQVIKQPSTQTEAWLLSTVSRLAADAGLPSTPEVAIYDSASPNAFATGPSRDNALVAVSSGLLRCMSRDEAEAVIGHEISHIANGDMVTLTLIQGVVNTFVIFFARVVGYFIDKSIFRNEGRGVGMGYFLTVMVLEMVFGILATMIVMAFSRWREFRADAGAAQLLGPRPMIGALRRLAESSGESLPKELNAFGIAGGQGALMRLLMSHPPISERIAALERLGH
jgi:heat shock protein HtpX